MSKKDYQAIAAALYGTREAHGRPESHAVLNRVAHALSDTLAASNPRFDRARFLEACETGSCKGMRRREVA